MSSRLHLNTIALEPNRWNRDAPPRFNLFDLLPEIAQNGFSFVELWEGHIRDFSGRTTQDARSLADALNLKLSITGLYPTIHLDGRAGKQQFDDVRALMTKSRKLGSDVVKFFVGSKASDETSESERQASLEFLRQMAVHANLLDLKLAGEFHANTLFDTVDSTLSVLNEIPELQVCFQPFDFGSTDQTLSDLRQLLPRVIHVHLQGRRNDEFATLEKADIDYAAFMSELQRNDYKGDLGIEFVVGCVTDNVSEHYLGNVLEAALNDADFVRTVAAKVALPLEG